jgi:hypothetical protein
MVVLAVPFSTATPTTCAPDLAVSIHLPNHRTKTERKPLVVQQRQKGKEQEESFY